MSFASLITMMNPVRSAVHRSIGLVHSCGRLCGTTESAVMPKPSARSRPTWTSTSPPPTHFARTSGRTIRELQGWARPGGAKQKPRAAGRFSAPRPDRVDVRRVALRGGEERQQVVPDRLQPLVVAEEPAAGDRRRSMSNGPSRAARSTSRRRRANGSARRPSAARRRGVVAEVVVETATVPSSVTSTVRLKECVEAGVWSIVYGRASSSGRHRSTSDH